MICRVLIKFSQNLSKKQAFKEHKLLTVRLLIIIKDKLVNSTLQMIKYNLKPRLSGRYFHEEIKASSYKNKRYNYMSRERKTGENPIGNKIIIQDRPLFVPL
jgi:hypothetical protein